MKLFSRAKKKTASLPKNPFEDPSSIGNILLSLGRITTDDLYTAVGQQAQFNDALLGSLLCQLGLATGSDIAKAMVIQEKMRSGHAVQAELDVLESKLTEAADGGRKLSQAIEAKKQERRDRGDSSGLFLVTATSVLRRA